MDDTPYASPLGQALRDELLADPTRLALIAETGLVDASAAIRLPTLDRVARIAARSVRAPIAQVNLVTADAQIPAAAFVDPAFRDATGSPLDPAAADLGGAWRLPVGLEASYCQHVVRRGTAVVVDDAANDPLVRDSRATRESGIGAYAAMPVVTPSGAILGTVCVVEFRPRVWTTSDLAAIAECAALAGEEVAARLGAAQALRESEERLRVALDAGRLGTWSLDLRTSELATSARCRATFGRAAGERLTYAELVDTVHPDDRPWVRATMQHAILTATDYSAEYRIVLRGGVERWVSAHGHPIIGSDGTVTRMVGVTQDVTERRVADAERARLHAAERSARGRAEVAQGEAETARHLLAESLDAITDPFYVIDDDLYVRVANRRACEWFGLTREQLIGAHMPTLFPQLVRTPAHDLVDRCFAERVPLSAEIQSTIHGRWVRLHAYPSPVGVAVYGEDIDDERRSFVERERLLVAEREARAVAEHANRAKSEFLAVMSHELRTPLNAIAGYAELIELGIHGPVTPAQLHALERIQKSQRHLLGLINGVLNYVRIDAGHLHYEIDDVVLDDLLATCEALVAPQARTRGVRLTHTGCGSGVLVRADGEKAQQIVINLLTNAVKFTEPGGDVSLHCEASATEATVRVRDTGIGIEADKLEAIFEPFVQVDARLTRTRDGVGLGLAISRDLARGMGGDLIVESAPGVGSTFTLTLPRAGA